METEKFDEAIRRKLDEINGESIDRSSEVDGIYRHILKKRHLQLKKNTIIFLGAMIVIVGGLYTWNVLQGKEIRELKQKVAHLKNAFKVQNPIVVHGKNARSTYFQAKGTAPALLTEKAQSASFNRPLKLSANQENSKGLIAHEKEISVSMPPKEMKPNLKDSPISEIQSELAPVKDSIYNSQKGVQAEEPAAGLVSFDGNEIKLVKQDSSTVKASYQEPSGVILDSAIKGPATELSAVKKWQYGIGASFEIGRLQRMELKILTMTTIFTTRTRTSFITSIAGMFPTAPLRILRSKIRSSRFR